MSRTTSITLGEHQQKFVETLVQSGRYTTTSEVVRDALRKLEETQSADWLLNQLIEGEKGESRTWDDQELLSHIKKEAMKRAKL
jgi:antitoxin ParD1/3/4